MFFRHNVANKSDLSFDKFLKSASFDPPGVKKPIVEHGLVKERAKLFEQKIEENMKMVENRKRPNYCAPTVASKARQKPPLKVIVGHSRMSVLPKNHATYYNQNNHYNAHNENQYNTHGLPLQYSHNHYHGKTAAKYEAEKDDILVMKIPSSYSGQSVQAWTWTSTSPRSTEEGAVNSKRHCERPSLNQLKQYILGDGIKCVVSADL